MRVKRIHTYTHTPTHFIRQKTYHVTKSREKKNDLEMGWFNELRFGDGFASSLWDNWRTVYTTARATFYIRCLQWWSASGIKGDSFYIDIILLYPALGYDTQETVGIGSPLVIKRDQTFIRTRPHPLITYADSKLCSHPLYAMLFPTIFCNRRNIILLLLGTPLLLGGCGSHPRWPWLDVRPHLELYATYVI